MSKMSCRTFSSPKGPYCLLLIFVRENGGNHFIYKKIHTLIFKLTNYHYRMKNIALDFTVFELGLTCNKVFYVIIILLFNALNKITRKYTLKQIINKLFLDLPKYKQSIFIFLCCQPVCGSGCLVRIWIRF